jgi:hypothetical protein
VYNLRFCLNGHSSIPLGPTWCYYNNCELLVKQDYNFSTINLLIIRKNNKPLNLVIIIYSLIKLHFILLKIQHFNFNKHKRWYYY